MDDSTREWSEPDGMISQLTDTELFETDKTAVSCPRAPIISADIMLVGINGMATGRPALSKVMSITLERAGFLFSLE